MNEKYQTRAERRAATKAKASRVLTPAVRRWAYGVAAAALTAAVALRWVPVEVAPVILPLVMALLYVDKDGSPKT